MELTIPKNAKVTNRSDSYMDRMYIEFENGHALSIICGMGSYGGDRGLFEIAPYNKDGEMDGKVLGFEYDDVEGHLSPEEVKNYIDIMNNKV